MKRYFLTILFIMFQLGVIICLLPFIVQFSHNAITLLTAFYILYSAVVIYLLYINAKENQEALDHEKSIQYLNQQIAFQQFNIKNIQQITFSLDTYQKKINQDLLNIYHDLSSNETSNTTEKCRDLKELYQKLQITNYCDNSMINSVLYPKCQFCHANNIPLEISLENINKGISNMDLVCIFSNLMDNAMEAVMKLPEDTERYIYLSGKQHTNYYFINLENAKSTNKEINFLTTEKENAKEHGHGLEIIKGIAEEYHGSFEIKEKKDSVIFSISLCMSQ